MLRFRLITISLAILVAHAITSYAQQMGVANMSVVCVREAPAHSAELGTQILMGFPVKILSKNGEWYNVETPDGYHGFVINHSLKVMDEVRFNDYRKAKKSVYNQYDEGKIYSDTINFESISDIVPGAIVEDLGGSNEWRNVSLPDKRTGWIKKVNLTPLDQWCSMPYDPSIVLAFAKAQLGKPYLWGGTSAKSMDCSGLSWMAYWMNGRILPRNASAQAKLPKKISNSSSLQPGDLLFFGNLSTGKVNHVGIVLSSDNKIMYIESAGRVKISQLKPCNKTVGQGFLHAISLDTYLNVQNTSNRDLFFAPEEN